MSGLKVKTPSRCRDEQIERRKDMIMAWAEGKRHELYDILSRHILRICLASLSVKLIIFPRQYYL